MDKHLKFSSKAEAELVLFDKVDDALVPKFGFSVDVVGSIYRQTGVVIHSDGGSIFETELVPGWHVNVRNVGEDDFCEYEVDVQQPVRVWA